MDEYLEAFGAVLIRGPKWCGKTTTAERKAKSVAKMQDLNKRKEYAKIVDIEPGLLLRGDKPRLIDEWQTYPILWDAVRTAVDESQATGQFILTGSAVPGNMSTLHSGTGRIARLTMRPMSSYEAGDSNGSVSLGKLFAGKETLLASKNSHVTVNNLIEIICRGGWPPNIGKSIKTAQLLTSQYIQALCEEDVSRVDGTERNPRRVAAVLQSYARNDETLATNKTILKDIANNDEGMTEPTLRAYLNALTRIYVIEEVPAWSPAIRSATAIRSSNKRAFVDPSLAVAALGLSPKALLEDLNTTGFLFENLCIRDLRVYSEMWNGTLSYYHDRYDLECDCVIHLSNGDFALVECKLGQREIDEGAEHLLTLKTILEQKKMKVPNFLMILTGGEYSYRRKDGVFVVPLECLKP